MSAPRDVPIRDSAPQSSRTLDNSSRTFDGSYRPSLQSSIQDAPPPTGSEVWSGAISRLQTQVSLNTSLLDAHTRRVADLETMMGRLNQEIGNVFHALQEIQAEVRARPSTAERPRHDSGDLEVLTEQVDAVTTKANEVDGLKMQIELMKNRMKRYEDQGSPAAPAARSSAPSALRKSSLHEIPAPPPPALSHQQPRPPSHQHPLPPMRTSVMMSPGEGRAPGLHAPPAPPQVPILQSQGTSSYRPSPDSRPYSTESSIGQASSTGSFRPVEPLPPASAFSGWRPAEPAHSSSSVPPPPPPPGPARHHTMEPEPQASGWATVNSNQPAKRPYEEPRASPYESPVTGSPKRPKLAPIMPRSTYSDDSYVPSSVTQTSTTESSFQPHSRVASDSSQSHSHAAPTPASSNTPGRRFIISTALADSQESWRPESDRMMHMHHHHPHHHGRHGHEHGHRRGGRGGRGARGGRSRHRGAHVHAPDSQELGTPEWEKPDWTGSQVSPNGYYNPMHHHHSPKEADRGGIVRRSGGFVGGPSEREHEFPATPVQSSVDPFNGSEQADDENGQHTSGGKKTRTKPIRNAEGVLIRKDGRPDMRSVSSANNLRKVHAKKEAERMEIEGRTPTSARELAPAKSTSLSDEEDMTRSGTPGTPGEGEGDERHAEERHRELMSRIFPRDTDPSGRSAAERFFPRQDQTAPAEPVMKTEPESEDASRNGGSQMTNVVMREMSEVRAEEHDTRSDRDTAMSSVEAPRKEDEREANHGPTETGEHAAEQPGA